VSNYQKDAWHAHHRIFRKDTVPLGAKERGILTYGYRPHKTKAQRTLSERG
jgi:hypothetical protein